MGTTKPDAAIGDKTPPTANGVGPLLPNPSNKLMDSDTKVVLLIGFAPWFKSELKRACRSNGMSILVVEWAGLVAGKASSVVDTGSSVGPEQSAKDAFGAWLLSKAKP